MQCSDVPEDPRCLRGVLNLAPLLAQAQRRERTSWIALATDDAWRKQFPGIYIVRWPHIHAPEFLATTGIATHAQPATPEALVRKWQSIVSRGLTDIVYVGRGDFLRKRVRLLAMFGVGRRDNHRGGEWMWQIEDIASSEVILITCPQGRQVGFENAFLERFKNAHDDYPLANRDGPDGPDRWWPGDL